MGYVLPIKLTCFEEKNFYALFYLNFTMKHFKEYKTKEQKGLLMSLQIKKYNTERCL